MSTSLNDLKWMKYSQREVDFILYNWSLINDEVCYPNDLDYLKIFYINCLSNNKLIIDASFFQRKKLVVNIESISWFKDDLRAGLFLSTCMYLKYRYLNFLIDFYGDFLKDLIVSIDCFHKNTNTIYNDFDSKSFSIRDKNFSMRQAFYMYKYYKTKPKDLSWLNQNSKEQLDWAMEYLQETGLLIQPYNFLPADNKESYIQICASIDALDLHPDLSSKISKKKDGNKKKSEREEMHVPISEQNKYSNDRHSSNQSTKKLDNLPHHPYTNLDLFHNSGKNSEHKEKLVNNMRNAWNQKVFRDKKPVKPEKQLKLPYGYNKKLDRIAEAYGENAIDSLKQILDKEYTDIQKI